ncbi:hypothetical protein GCM10022393_13180 [Aquimarina addita]|uniref:YARHG domain-containing protein n=1 Tax=Aquimarina addita TaxID=870485 RepID=A0ABP7XEZ9_9FLAO
MDKSIYTILSILFFAVSCNTKKENQKLENTIKSNTDLSIVFTASELKSKSLEELRLIRNEIYARKGYVFKSEVLQNHFENKEWYVPKEKEKITLSENEKHNVDLIKQIEAEKKKEFTLTKPSNEDSSKYSDTIVVNYKDNKKILDILTLFPETNMGSWDWSQKERIDLVNEIKKNNFFIDIDPIFLNIKYVEPNTIGLSVIDGFWTLSVYDIDLNTKLVITNNIVGDGNSFTAYKLKNQKLKILNLDTIFGDYFNSLLKNNSEGCASLLNENEITFDYDFSHPEFIKISSWYLHKIETDCFKGNTIILKLNKSKSLFETKEVLWEENK